MTNEEKIQRFMQEFRTTYMVASDYLFANDDDYSKAANDFRIDTSE